MSNTYKVSVPFISSKEVQEVTKVLRSGWLTSGPKTKVLEEIIKNIEEKEERWFELSMKLEDN